MIVITYPPETTEIESWKSRLDATFAKYELKKVPGLLEPILEEAGKIFQGIPAIEEFIKDSEQFFATWYEDRCDKHDFFPD